MARVPTHITHSRDFWMFIYFILRAHICARVYYAHRVHGAQKRVLEWVLGTDPRPLPSAVTMKSSPRHPNNNFKKFLTEYQLYKWLSAKDCDRNSKQELMRVTCTLSGRSLLKRLKHGPELWCNAGHTVLPSWTEARTGLGYRGT